MKSDNQNPSSSEMISSPKVIITNQSGVTESSVQPITRHKLNGQNYLQWSQSIMLFICGKGKDDYLTGAVTTPSTEDSKYKVWKAENSMVMSWLVNSMSNDIGLDFMYYDTAKEIWDAAKETYSDKENTSELFEIKGILHDLRQGELTVTQYFNTLNRYWQQLDRFDDAKLECSDCNIKYKKIVEKERIFKFLLGLNKNLDKVRGRILAVKPLPSICEAFSEVRREAGKRLCWGIRIHLLRLRVQPL